MNRPSFFIVLLAFSPFYSNVQAQDPVSIARKLFSQDSLPDIAAYITGEYTGEPNGRNLSPAALLEFRLLQQTAASAVVAMTITDSAGKGLDTYLHFKKDTVWKMCAFRALAMTGVFEQLKQELEQMEPAALAAMIKKSKKEKRAEFKTISSMEDYYFELGNARMILELDKNIIAHFKQQQALFDSLKNEALAEMQAQKTNNGGGHKPLLENQKARYRKLFISAVSFGDYETGRNCLVFLLGGILDNTVGYLFTSDEKDLPAMSPDNIIMLIAIGNGWYLYKTT